MLEWRERQRQRENESVTKNVKNFRSSRRFGMADSEVLQLYFRNPMGAALHREFGTKWKGS